MRTTLYLVCFALITIGAAGCDSEPACHDDCDGVGGGAGQGTGGGGHGAHAGSSGASGQSGDLATEYCDCMLTACHDEYHATFGPESDEVAARQACLSTAAAVPVNGSPVTQGNFIECRIHHCELGKTNASACPASIGQGACQ